jgi:hypothetical protein
MPPSPSEFERALSGMFRKAGWRVRRDPDAHLVLDAAKKTYVVRVRAVSEVRSDRLIPLLSQAILETRALAHDFAASAKPLVVIAAKRVPPASVDRLMGFASRFAPDVPLGVIDLDGLRAFQGDGFERLNAKPRRKRESHAAPAGRLPSLFSDLNQWMLKVLLGQRLAEDLISVPREPIRNAAHLAALANVSVMSASRLVRQLAARGFLADEEDGIQLARVPELCELWASESRQGVREFAARWIIKRGPDQLRSALSEAMRPRKKARTAQPRCCLGLFAAADALGLSFVHGVAPVVYVERLAPEFLHSLGLTLDPAARDVTLRIPKAPEAVFRACVDRSGLPVSDVLQVWLDVSGHPARGREQAREIRRRVLAPLLGKR